MTRETSASQRGAVEDVPVEMIPTTAREHITGFDALNIPHAWRLGGDWHEAWFGVKPTRVSPHHITDERRFGRLLDRLGHSGLRDARPGLTLLGHPAGDWPEKVWAATHERAVIEMARARLDGITAEDLPIGLPPVDRYSFERILPYPDQWVRVRWWTWRLRGVLTPMELAAWDEWKGSGGHELPTDTVHGGRGATRSVPVALGRGVPGADGRGAEPLRAEGRHRPAVRGRTEPAIDRPRL